MIVLVGAEKGGTGKSTIATNFAVMRAMAGRDVLLVDADPQQSSSLWAGMRSEAVPEIEPNITCVAKTGPQAGYDIVNLVSKFDDVIIDAGGRDSPQLRSCLVICDVHVLPLVPSQFDSWTLDTMNELINNANMQRAMVKMPALTSKVVCSKASPNPSLREHLEVQEYVEDFDSTMKMVPITLFDRVVFRKAIKEGKGVVEMAPATDKAVEELAVFYKQVFSEAYKPKKLSKGVAK